MNNFASKCKNLIYESELGKYYDDMLGVCYIPFEDLKEDSCSKRVLNLLGKRFTHGVHEYCYVLTVPTNNPNHEIMLACTDSFN